MLPQNNCCVGFFFWGGGAVEVTAASGTLSDVELLEYLQCGAFHPHHAVLLG